MTSCPPPAFRACSTTVSPSDAVIVLQPVVFTPWLASVSAGDMKRPTKPIGRRICVEEVVLDLLVRPQPLQLDDRAARRRAVRGVPADAALVHFLLLKTQPTLAMAACAGAQTSAAVWSELRRVGRLRRILAC